jgi:hypothetical protein
MAHDQTRSLLEQGEHVAPAPARVPRTRRITKAGPRDEGACALVARTASLDRVRKGFEIRDPSATVVERARCVQRYPACVGPLRCSAIISVQRSTHPLQIATDGVGPATMASTSA